MSLRVMRVELHREVSFEISVPFSRGRALFERLLELGKPDGSAVRHRDHDALRTEKGYLHVAADTDGRRSRRTSARSDRRAEGN